MKHVVRITVVLAVTLFVAISGGCGSDPEEEAVKQVLIDQVDFLQEENLEGALSTMHPESPQYSSSRAVMEQVFELYELEYEIEEIEVLEVTGNEAKIRAVQVTRRIEGPELADKRVVAVHTLRKTEGGWKLYESEHESSETLDPGGE